MIYTTICCHSNIPDKPNSLLYRDFRQSYPFNVPQCHSINLWKQHTSKCDSSGWWRTKTTTHHNPNVRQTCFKTMEIILKLWWVYIHWASYRVMFQNVWTFINVNAIYFWSVSKLNRLQNSLMRCTISARYDAKAL